MSNVREDGDWRPRTQGQWVPTRGASKRAALAITLLCSVMPAAPGSAQDLATLRVATGLTRPVFATAPPGDHSRLFIVEQHTGKIKILDRAAASVDHGNPFLTVPDLAIGGEQGLLGLAFHPDYQNNGLFYIHRIRGTGDNVIDEYQVSIDPDLASTPATRTLLAIAQPQENHNGGWLGFGPDGYLYIAVGDGGNRDDMGLGHPEPTGNAQQTTNNLLGKILRIDVDAEGVGTPYAIPPGNPFVGTAGDDEIWAYGLRHPWRPSFDRLTGDLFIADVGQDAIEEINFQPADSSGGENYGWRLREGTIATPTGGVGGAAPPGAIDPIYDYAHAPNLFSITGGYVYRGPVAALQGSYVFADFGGPIFALDFDGSDPSEFDGTNFTNLRMLNGDLTPDAGSIESISSFGEDADGNLYIIDLGSPFVPNTQGEVYLVVPEAARTLAQLAGLLALAACSRGRRSERGGRGR